MHAIRIGQWHLHAFYWPSAKDSGMAILPLAGSSTFVGGIMKSASGNAIVVAIMIATIPLIHPSVSAQGDPSDGSRKASQGRPARGARRAATSGSGRYTAEDFRGIPGESTRNLSFEKGLTDFGNGNGIPVALGMLRRPNAPDRRRARQRLLSENRRVVAKSAWQQCGSRPPSL